MSRGFCVATQPILRLHWLKIVTSCVHQKLAHGDLIGIEVSHEVVILGTGRIRRRYDMICCTLHVIGGLWQSL